MSTPFEEKRLGRVLLSEAFVTGKRSKDVFENFAVLIAMPRYNDPGIIAYFGAHPDFEPYDGNPKDAPYYDPYWNDDGFYFKKKSVIDPFKAWLKELDKIFNEELGLGYDDFADYDWHAEFEGDNTPRDSYEEWNLMAGPDSGEM